MMLFYQRIKVLSNHANKFNTWHHITSSSSLRLKHSKLLNASENKNFVDLSENLIATTAIAKKLENQKFC